MRSARDNRVRPPYHVSFQPAIDGSEDRTVRCVRLRWIFDPRVAKIRNPRLARAPGDASRDDMRGRVGTRRIDQIDGIAFDQPACRADGPWPPADPYVGER